MKHLFSSRISPALVAAAGLAIALVTAPSAAFAYPNWSDENIAQTRGFVAQSLNMLQHDDRDYGGHRLAAVQDLSGVEGSLMSALQYDATHDRAADPRVIAPRNMESWLRRQGASNENIETVDAYLQSAVTMLEQDQRDYGGYRVRAIQGLEAARAQLRGALAYINNNPGNNNPGADNGSDRNMQYARWYIERGIDQLQNDQRDYSGHREGAIDAMQQARADILAGLRADANDPRFAAIAPPDANAMYALRRQNASNENLEFVRGMVQHAVAMLNRDNHDYDGFRVKAVSELGQARVQLDQALATVGENGSQF